MTTTAAIDRLIHHSIILDFPPAQVYVNFSNKKNNKMQNLVPRNNYAKNEK